ncbi:MAG: hypothetical protein MUE94_03600 [Verrucomicrobia bacterium]|jgi:hypothetical protein|nr:hypothetical protein [Verrucomicrobiota bacterium]
MRQAGFLLFAALVSVGCDTLKGPNQSYVVPAVEGRVVDVCSGQALPHARIQRHLRAPAKSDPLDRHGSEQLLMVPTVRSDAEGRFWIAPEKAGYLLLEHPGVLEFTLVVRHATHQTLTTNIDLVHIKPVKTNNLLTVFVGDLPLEPKDGN